jgi:hypothetical protein
VRHSQCRFDGSKLRSRKPGQKPPTTFVRLAKKQGKFSVSRSILSKRPRTIVVRSPKKLEENHSLKIELSKVAVNHPCEIGKKCEESDITKFEFGNIAKKTEENHGPKIEISNLAAPMVRLQASERKRRSVTSHQKPKAKWAACASASGLVASLLLLGLSSDRQDQLERKLAFVTRGDRSFAGQGGATKPLAWEPRKAEVAVANAKKAETIGHADAAKTEPEAATRRTTTLIIFIRGGRRENAARLPVPTPP